MSALLIILVITILFIAGGGLALFLMFSRRQTVSTEKSAEQSVTPTTPVTNVGFRWQYVLLPLIILLISIIIAVCFYGKLPDDIAYHFTTDGTPDAWLSRNAFMLWTLVPQVLLTVLALITTWGITKLSPLFRLADTGSIKPKSLLLVMGNMVVLPQLIICFAMLSTFSYNSFQVRIMPIWAFGLIIIVLGVIWLGIFFIRTIRKVLGASR